MEKLHAGMSGRRPQANRTLDVLSAVWTWAARQKHVDGASNPAKGVEKYGESGRERYLSKNEFLRFSEALTAAETIGLPYSVDEFGPKAKHAPKPEKRLRKFDQPCDRGNSIADTDGSSIARIASRQMGAHRFRARDGLAWGTARLVGSRCTCSRLQAAAILSTLPRLDGNPYVFPGEKNGQPRADLKRPWDAICTAAGLDGVRLHDLRHSFASVGAGASLGLPIIGKLLATSSRPQRSAMPIWTRTQ